ncbi:MAG: exonuclease subunit SbcD [Saprospiraceae bacterium]
MKSIKILHTADWHIGKHLHKFSLEEEFLLFIDWLKSTIQKENIDVLLVSGDIFDYANPTNHDIQLYYKVLVDLHILDIQIIITGGNHDSPSMLNAPREILEKMNISVIGALSSEWEDHLIPVMNEGETVAVIIAVPFLREKDIRKSRSLQENNSFSEESDTPIQNIYTSLVNLSREKYGLSPSLLAMGHLHLFGSVTSDSEREIHIGNLGGLPSSIFSHDIDYVALGHIHKPQKINGKQPIYYSGSPIFLDFSERDYEKKLMVVELKASKEIVIEKLPIPTFRKLLKVSGNIHEVAKKLVNLNKETNLLPSFIELEVNPETNPLEEKKILNEIMEEYIDSPTITILKSRFIQLISSDVLLTSSDQLKHIEEMSPKQVFQRLLESKNVDSNSIKPLEIAFMELVENLHD